MDQTPDTFYDLFFGYTVIWLCIAVFLVKLVRDQRRSHAEIKAMRLEVSELSAERQSSSAVADLAVSDLAVADVRSGMAAELEVTNRVR